MSKIDLEKIIKKLSKKRPVFHSEADFQFSLAWEIKLNYKNSNIRLEKPFDLRNNKNSYLDLFIELNKVRYAIELKYKTSHLAGEFNKEKFYLLNQGGQNIGKYDFVKDIYRLERLKEHKQVDFCYAIMLTNEKTYFNKTKHDNKTASQFNIYHTNILKRGSHAWNLTKEQKAIKGRTDNLFLEKDYILEWQNYSNKGDFKYLLLDI